MQVHLRTCKAEGTSMPSVRIESMILTSNGVYVGKGLGLRNISLFLSIWLTIAILLNRILYSFDIFV